MAQVSSGSFNTSSAEGRYLTFNWSVESTDIELNYKTIKWSLVGAGASGYVICGNFRVVIDGVEVWFSSERRNIWQGTLIANGTKIIYHTENGTRSFSASVEAGIYEVAVNCRGSGSWELPTIPRTANITSFSVSQRDEHSVVYNFTTDSNCDYAWYSLDDGATWNSLPNHNVITGLTANTTYKFKLRVRKTDSRLTTDSSTYQQTTIDYPHCIESPDFTIGEALTLKFFNPLGREITITGYAKSDGSQIFAGKTAANSLTGFNVDDENGGASAQYKSIPDAQSGEYKVVVSYNGVEKVRDTGNVYRIRGNEIPTIYAFDYIDTNSDVVAITGDNTQIVQNKSILQARFHSADAHYWASGIVNYVLECNGITISGDKAGSYDIGTIDSTRDVELKLTAYDSRGLSASKTLTVKMVAYETPTATVELERLNNYEDETYLTVNGYVSSVNFKNTKTIQYRYKQTGGEYGAFITIDDRVKQTLSLDKSNSFVVNVVVTDAFGSQFNAEYGVAKGVFPLFIDTVKNSVGINCFPKKENSLEVNGKDLFDFVSQYEKSHKQILLNEAGGLVISVESVYGSDKIPIVVTGADNASYKPVHTIIQYRTDGYFEHINLGYECTITRDGKYVHINAQQWSYFQVSVPMGSEITLENRAL